MTSGAPLVTRVAFKPLATLMKPLHSVDIGTKAEAKGAIERSDVCAIPAAAVIAEAVVAFVIADVFLEGALAEATKGRIFFIETHSEVFTLRLFRRVRP